MTPRTQNLVSIGVLVAALAITLLPESPSATRTAAAPVQVSQLSR
jgi:hypothetical protein